MKINKNVAISDSGFIFNPDTGESFTANPIGMEMLEMLKSGMEYEEIQNNIMDKYKSDKDTVEKDYHDFIIMLKQYKLIEDDGEKDI